MSSTENHAPKPIRCLVIQLARLGDTIQSLMALRAARELYPQLEIHFMARENFSHAAKRVPWIRSVITFPTEELLGPALSGKKKESQTLGEIASWLAPVVAEPWDLIINWSFSEASSYLTALLPAKIKLGYSRRDDLTFSGVDGWSHYIQAVVQGNIQQNIHLTDILTTQLLTALQIHAGDPLTDGNTPATSKNFFSLSVQSTETVSALGGTSGKWLGIQIGAGSASKNWSAQSWAHLLQYIIRRHSDHSVILLGSTQDQELEKEILGCLNEHLNGHTLKPRQLVSLVGKTSFDDWTYVLSRCQWLFAGDTAALHLASVLGTKVICVPVQAIRYSETGPYGNGHYVITQNKEGGPSAEAVYATWTYARTEWTHKRLTSIESHFAQLSWSDHLKGTEIYRSRIRSTPEGGGLVFDPMIKRSLNLENWCALVVGQVARTWYCGWTPPIGQELTRESLSPSLIKMLRELSESSDVLAQVCDQANETAFAMAKKSGSLKSNAVMGVQDREEIKALAKTLYELELLIERLAQTHPALRTFSQMTKVLMHHLQSKKMSELGTETSLCYKQLGEGVAVFKQWILFSLHLAKPVAVQSQSQSRQLRALEGDL
jgi:ADP-heptose:LPS heptosyltransferase